MERFAWFQATGVEEAARAARSTVADAMGPTARAPGVTPVAVVKAGGIDLLDLMKQRLLSPATLVSLGQVGGLDRIVDDGAPGPAGVPGLRIGARVTLQQLAADPLVRRRYTALGQAAEGSASPQIRQVATLAGNLLQRPRCGYFRSAAFPCLRKGGSTCFALGGQNIYHAVFDNVPCAIVHPSTPATALVALNARVERMGCDGAVRTTPLESFLVGPATDPQRENQLQPGEIVTALRLPAPRRGLRSAHVRLGEREGFDWPLVDVAVMLELDDRRRCQAASVVLGAVAPVPHRARASERALAGRTVDESTAAAAAKAATEGARPLSGNAYKLPLIEALVERAVLQAAAQEEEP